MPPEQFPAGPSSRIIDLFAGPGGLDVGATWLGISTTGIELDGNACATRAAAGLVTIRGDVREYGPEDFPDATVLTGGPPCQTFTVAGSGTGRQALDDIVRGVRALAERPCDRTGIDFTDERTGLVLEPMRWAMSALHAGSPYEAIVLEQVPAVLPIWEAFGGVLAAHGYSVAYGVLRSEEYGVPQTRRRAILIARLGNTGVTLPPQTHQAFRKGSSGQVELGLEPWVPMRAALERETKFTVVSNYGSGGDPRNRGQRRCDEPAATVTGKVMRNRLRLPGGTWSRLSHQEAGVLQTFPRDFPWSGGDVGQQIGNAIPPRLAVHVLAHALRIKIESSELDRVVRSPWVESKNALLHPRRRQTRNREMAAASD